MTAHKGKSIRTPLGRARGLGSAKDGTAHWWAMRVTSVLMLPLFLYLAASARYFLPMPGDWASLIVLLAEPHMTVILSLAIIIGFYHGCLGMQTVIEDYVHHEGAKISCLLLNRMFFLFSGTASVFAILYITFALLGEAGRM